MGGVDALVAEVAVDLEDPVEAADDGALEPELRCDAQVEVEVPGDHVGRVRPGVGAAVDHLQHRGLDLEELPRVERLAQRPDDRDPLQRTPAGVGVGPQVDVALPDPRLLGELPVLHRRRLQRLAGERVGGGHHRQLATAGGDHAAGHADLVAEVDVGLPGGEAVLADLGEREHHLDVGTSLADGREAELAGVALEHHATRDADDLTGVGVGGQVGVGGAQRGDRRRPRVADGVGVGAGLDEPVVLLPPDPYLAPGDRRSQESPRARR